jgi:hypothetical protein
MRSIPKRVLAFTLYQLSLFAAIALFPLAIVARKFGVTLPMHRVVSRFGHVYDEAATPTA